MFVAWQNTHSLPGGGQDSDIYAKTKSFTGGGTDTFAYGYDRLSRLTSVTGPDGSPTYGYAPVGNRTSKVVGSTLAYTPLCYTDWDLTRSCGSAAFKSDTLGGDRDLHP